MKPVVFLLLAAFFSPLRSWSQDLNPNYDAALAASVGADDYGMKNYVLVILKTGPKDSVITDKAHRSELFRGHMDNIKKLADENKLVVAGPFGRNDHTFRGLFIFNVSTVEEARQLCNTDPAVSAGIFTLELVPWYGSAALGEYLPASKKVAKYRF